MSSYPTAQSAESVAQSPPSNGFAHAGAGPHASHGAHIYMQAQDNLYLQQGVTYPQVVAVTNIRPPNSFLAWSIVSCIIFCLPLGIAALVFSLGVNTDFALGLHIEARRKSKVACWLNVAATVLGIAGWIAVGVLLELTYTPYNSVYANAGY